MADGDVFRKLGRAYQKAYECLCEGKATSAEGAQSVMQALKKDLQRKGDLPIILAKQMGEKLTQILGDLVENSLINWGSVNKEVEKIVQVDGRHDLKELILRAGKSFIQELRYGYNQEININGFTESILGRFMNEVFESGFKESIPLIDKHYAGIDVATLGERIKDIQPVVDSAIAAWAKKANIDGSVANLRLPNRRLVNPIDMEENLC